MKNMKIVTLESRNVKRLKAVRIEPNGNLVVIGGKNDQGKSSVLDSIMYAIGGKDTLPARPLRDGEAKGEVVCDLGDLVVRRSFTEGGGGTLTVTDAAGKKQSSPQGILDGLLGELSFDPLRFAAMSAADQAATLKRLVGLDFTEIDAKRKDAYERRTDVNRDAKRLEAQLAGMPRRPDVPAQEISVDDAMAELARTQEHNDAVRTSRRELAAAEQGLAGLEREYQSLQEQVKALQERASGVAKRINDGEIYVEQRREEVAGLAEIDTAPVQEKLRNLGQINDAVRSNRRRACVQGQLDAAREESERLTLQLTDIDEVKQEAIAGAEFPVPGLGFDEGGVTVDGIPFEQCSTSKKLRVSVAMGLALNPELRVLLIRDGSHLDEDGLRLVAEMATTADAQVWLERVGKGGEVAVVIEDGEVAEVRS